jgi:hypothetical protein
MMDLKAAVHKLEDAIIVVSGPALAVSGILAGVDLLTGGNMLKDAGWLTLAWAITLMLSLDFQVLTLGVRAKRIYLSDKANRRKTAEIILACIIAAGIAFVSVQMQSIIARSNGVGISVEQATLQLGINPIWLVWERSALVLFLIFLAGWFRESETVKQTVSQPETPTSEEVVQALLANLEQSIMEKLAAYQVQVNEMQEQLLAIPEHTVSIGETPETESDGASLQAAIAGVLVDTPTLSSREIAERLQRSHSTVYRAMKQEVIKQS